MQNDIDNIDKTYNNNSIINDSLNSFTSENSTKYYEFSSEHENEEDCLSW